MKTSVNLIMPSSTNQYTFEAVCNKLADVEIAYGYAKDLNHEKYLMSHIVGLRNLRERMRPLKVIVVERELPFHMRGLALRKTYMQPFIV